MAKPRKLMSRHYRYENGKLVLKSEHEMKRVDPSTLPPTLLANIQRRMKEAEDDLRELATRQSRRRRKSA